MDILPSISLTMHAHALSSNPYTCYHWHIQRVPLPMCGTCGVGLCIRTPPGSPRPFTGHHLRQQAYPHLGILRALRNTCYLTLSNLSKDNSASRPVLLWHNGSYIGGRVKQQFACWTKLFAHGRVCRRQESPKTGIAFGSTWTPATSPIWSDSVFGFAERSSSTKPISTTNLFS